MKNFLYILFIIFLGSCNSQKEGSLFQNEKGQYIDIQYYKQEILPGFRGSAPYTQYTVVLTPSVEGDFEVRDSGEKSLVVSVQNQTQNGVQSNLITFTNREQQFNEDELILVWDNGYKGLFSKLPRPDEKEPLALP